MANQLVDQLQATEVIRRWPSTGPVNSIVANQTTVYCAYPGGPIQVEEYIPNGGVQGPESLLSAHPGSITYLARSSKGVMLAYRNAEANPRLFRFDGTQLQWESEEFVNFNSGTEPAFVAMTPSGDTGVVAVGTMVSEVNMETGDSLWSTKNLIDPSYDGPLTGLGILAPKNVGGNQVVVASSHRLTLLTYNGKTQEHVGLPSPSLEISAIDTNWNTRHIYLGDKKNCIYASSGKTSPSFREFASLGEAVGTDKKGIAGIATFTSDTTKEDFLAAISYGGTVALFDGKGTRLWGENTPGRFNNGGAVALAEDRNGSLYLFLGYYEANNACLRILRFTNGFSNKQ